MWRSPPHSSKTVFDFVEIQTKGNAGMSILRGIDGFELILTRPQQTGWPLYPKTFHVGFLVPSEQDAEMAYQRLIATGLDRPEPPRPIRRKPMIQTRRIGVKEWVEKTDAVARYLIGPRDQVRRVMRRVPSLPQESQGR